MRLHCTLSLRIAVCSAQHSLFCDLLAAVFGQIVINYLLISRFAHLGQHLVKHIRNALNNIKLAVYPVEAFIGYHLLSPVRLVQLQNHLHKKPLKNGLILFGHFLLVVLLVCLYQEVEMINLICEVIICFSQHLRIVVVVIAHHAQHFETVVILLELNKSTLIFDGFIQAPYMVNEKSLVQQQ